MACELTNPADEGGDPLWKKAFGDFMSGLTAKQRSYIGAVSSAHQLTERVTKLQRKYEDGRTSRCLGRVTSVLEWFASFNKCVTSFLQASPPEFVLLWGSLSFLLEVFPPSPWSAEVRAFLLSRAEKLTQELNRLWGADGRPLRSWARTPRRGPRNRPFR